MICYLNMGGVSSALACGARISGIVAVGQTLRRASPLSGSQLSKFQPACPQPQHLQYVGMARWAGRKPARFFKKAVGVESSDDEFGILSGGRRLHRHRCLSRTLPPARVGVCLQPILAAAATTQLHYPDSSRLVRRKDCSSVRSGSPAGCRDFGSGRARDLMRSVVARVGLGRLCQGNKSSKSARRCHGKRRGSWTGDAFCRQDADQSFRDTSEQDIDFPQVPVPNNDEFGADVVPFQLRFLEQELIFAHCPYLSLPCLIGNLLCRGWLSFSEMDCGLRLCYSADPRDCQLSKMQQQQAAQGREALPGAPPCWYRRPPTVLLWFFSENHQDIFQADRRNNEHDADAAPLLPRFLPQELFFARCPHQPRPPVRGNLLNKVYKADWLSLRGIFGRRVRHLADPDISQLLSARPNRALQSGTFWRAGPCRRYGREW